MQFILLVRDDYWLGAARLFRELELPLREGENLRVVDLFDAKHARHVFGRSARHMGRWRTPHPRPLSPGGEGSGAPLPAGRGEPTPLSPWGRGVGGEGGSPSGEGSGETSAFLDEAVRQLGEDGKVVPVRLSLFAELMKSRPWTRRGSARGRRHRRARRHLPRRDVCVAVGAPGASAAGGGGARGPGRASARRRRRHSRSRPTPRRASHGVRPRRRRRRLREIAGNARSRSAPDHARRGRRRCTRRLSARTRLSRPGRAAVAAAARADDVARPGTAAAGGTRRAVGPAPGAALSALAARVRFDGFRRAARSAAARRASHAALGVKASRCEVRRARLAAVLLGWGAWEAHGQIRSRGVVEAIESATLAEADRIVTRRTAPLPPLGRRPPAQACHQSRCDPRPEAAGQPRVSARTGRFPRRLPSRRLAGRRSKSSAAGSCRLRRWSCRVSRKS